MSELEEKSIEYVNLLTDNKAKEMRKEMIKFLKESHYQDSFEYAAILEFVNDFFILEKSSHVSPD